LKEQDIKDVLIFSRNALILFLVSSIILIIYFSSSTSYKSWTVDPNNSHPIELEADYNHQVFKILIAGIPQGEYGSGENTWNYTPIDILDKNLDYEYSLSFEFWEESGYDEGYAWHETDLSTDYHIVRAEKGKFYLQIPQMENSSEFPYIINISVKKQGGSTVIFYILAFISLGGFLLLQNFKDELIQHIASKHVKYE
jgi:TRAP-type mannitol/chloroaromatic compound transport system permease small subunit